MFSTKVLIFGVLCLVSVKSERKLCDFNDEKCLTKGSNRSFEKFIAGIPGVPPSDPLSVDLIEGSSPSMKYKIIDATLSGLKKCRVHNVGISLEDDKYNYQIKCPHLIIELNTEVNGDIGEGKGTCKVLIENYLLKYRGDYAKSQDANGKLHMNLQTHDLVEDPVGKVNIDCKNADASQELSSDKWQAVGNEILKAAFDSLKKKYISNVNTYLKVVPVEDIFYQE